MSVFRIQRLSRREAGDRPKGYNSSYRFFWDNVPIYQCHSSRSCLKSCEFTPLYERHSTGFVLKPSRPIIPTTWIVEEISGRLRYGTLKRKLFGKVDWKLQDAEGKQIAVFVGIYERRFWLIRLIDFFMGANLPYRYELISGGETLATMEKERRPDSGPTEKKGIVAIFIGKVLVNMDWVVKETGENAGRLDHRLILSGALLLNKISRDINGFD